MPTINDSHAQSLGANFVCNENGLIMPTDEDEDERWKMLGVRFPAALHKRLRLWSVENEVPIAQLFMSVAEILLDEGDELGERLRERLTGG